MSDQSSFRRFLGIAAFGSVAFLAVAAHLSSITAAYGAGAMGGATAVGAMIVWKRRKLAEDVEVSG